MNFFFKLYYFQQAQIKIMERNNLNGMKYFFSLPVCLYAKSTYASFAKDYFFGHFS